MGEETTPKTINTGDNDEETTPKTINTGDNGDETTPKTTTSPMRSVVFSKVGGGRNNKQIFVMEIPEDKFQDKMGAIRTIMATTKGQKDYSTLPFCNESGATISDTWSIKRYLNEVNKPGSTSLVAFLRRTSDRSEIADSDIPQTNLELPPDAPQLLVPNLQTLASKVDKRNWFSKPRKTKDLNPAQLKEKEWSIVTENNSLCYGLCILRHALNDETVIPIGVARARYPAFQIKEQKMTASRVAGTDLQMSPDLKLRIPDFTVEDQSYVSIFETQTQFQSSLSHSSFSQWDVQGSIGMNAMGGKLGVSGGYKQSNTDQSMDAKSGNKSQMNISYNFPRVALLLDEHSLELTQECKDYLDKVQKKQLSLASFKELFGECFSTRVQLGGRLFASEEFDSSSTADATATKFSMKAQAAASFKKPLSVSASASGGYGKSTGNATTDSSGQMQNTLQWNANGGDTLLCNNPPEWCPTVASFHNWRIINRADHCYMIYLIAKIMGKAPLETTPDITLDQIIAGAPPEPKLMFYLRGLKKDNVAWRYLTLYQKSICRPLPDKQWAYNATMSPTVDDCDDCGLYFEVVTTEKQPVHTIMYGVPYLIRNPSTGLYLCLIWGGRDPGSSSYCIARPYHEDMQPWYFRSSQGKTEGEIKQCDTVSIRHGAMSGKGSTIISTYAHIQAENYAIVARHFSDPTFDHKQEKSFQFLFKDIWDKKQKDKLPEPIEVPPVTEQEVGRVIQSFPVDKIPWIIKSLKHMR